MTNNFWHFGITFIFHRPIENWAFTYDLKEI